MSALTDLWNTIHGILLAPDWVPVVIMAVVAIALAFFSEGLGSLVTVVLGALVVFGLALFARGAITTGGKDLGGLAQADWHNVMVMPTGTLLAYAIIFAVVIAIVGAIRTAIGR
ncbi:MAG TPA: hypothetical protein VGG48_05995 [Rhizomicrobium sp.]|jgi:hypothetical protein